jgi:hypothetical protein
MGLQWMDGEIGNDLCSFIDDMISSRQYSNPTLSRQLRLFKLFYSELPEAKELYIDRMAIYLGDFLRTANGQELIDAYVADIEPEYLRHLQVYYNDVPNTSAYRYSGGWGWKGYLKYFRDTWWSKRKSNMFNLLRSRFNLGAVITLNMERNNVPVTFNDIDLQLDKYYGKWFVGRKMNLSTQKGCGWRVTVTTSSNKTSVSEVLNRELSYTPASDVSTVKVEVIENPNDGVNDITVDDANISVTRSDNTIFVNSDKGLQRVAVYGSDGRMFNSISNLNGANQCAVENVSNVLINIVVVTLHDGTTKTLKL